MRGLGGKFCVKTPLKFGSTWKVITVFQAADFQSEFLFAEISVKCFYCCHWKHASVEAVCLGEDYSCRESMSDRGRHFAKCTVTLQVRSQTQDKNIHRIIWSCFFFFLLSNNLNYSNIHGISYWASSMMDLMSGDWIQCITADTQNFQFNQANFALCWQKGPRSKPIIRLRAILVKQRSLWVTLTSSYVHMRLG